MNGFGALALHRQERGASLSNPPGYCQQKEEETAHLRPPRQKRILFPLHGHRRPLCTVSLFSRIKLNASLLALAPNITADGQEAVPL